MLLTTRGRYAPNLNTDTVATCGFWHRDEVASRVFFSACESSLTNLADLL
jgi:hypothetical protein